MPSRRKPQTIQEGLVAPLQQAHGQASRAFKEMDKRIQNKPVLKRVLPRLAKTRKK